jgi:hypothetical protein
MSAAGRVLLKSQRSLSQLPPAHPSKAICITAILVLIHVQTCVLQAGVVEEPEEPEPEIEVDDEQNTRHASINKY